MSNSSLVNHTRISPNCNARNRSIRKITIHHMAGNLTVEQCGNVFASSDRQASSNYGIGSDGRVGLYVPEDHRSWASSSPVNDHQAVTIEVANDQIGGDWHVSDAAYAKLIDLVVDICKRNGISQLVWTGDSSGTLTCHYMFAPTACPGPYLKSRMADIASEVNARLSGGSYTPLSPAPAYSPTNTGDIRYRVRTNGVWLPEMVGHYDTGGSVDTWAGNGNPIQYVSMDFPGWYQVKTREGGWLDKVYKYDPNDLVYGAAGDGSDILALRCWYETPNPAETGYYQIEYQVANVGGDFLPPMVDLTDSGGSTDDFAGNGGVVGRIRARRVS